LKSSPLPTPAADRNTGSGVCKNHARRGIHSAGSADLSVSISALSALHCTHMRVLGIDCGGEYTGYGVVEIHAAGKLCCLSCGAIKLSPREALPRRLSRIFTQLGEIISEHRPDEVAIEDVFYALNVKSALKLGQVRGVAMLAAATAGLEVAEYSPLTIKSSVVGYGRAEKQQVQHMVTRLLELAVPPEPMDASDALAIAICHLHTAATLRKQRA
jgi:crossover junction endodeoxyribonuclease RuvC